MRQSFLSEPVGRRPTIMDVARAAGVSPATVSQVLGGNGRISAKTRARVLQAIEQTGYVYNLGAASLRTSATRTVGLLVHDIANPFYAEMTSGVAEVLEGGGYVVHLANSAEDPARQDVVLESFRRHNVAGCVICPVRETSDASLARQAGWGVPTLLAVRDIPQARFDFVGVENEAGVRCATEHLLALGHRHIAFLGGLPQSLTRAERRAGWLRALREAGIDPPDALDVCCPASLQAGRDGLLALIDGHPETTAVVCYHDVVALGVIIGLQAVGRTAGVEFGVTGFDDIEASRLWSPSLTTISATPRRLGIVAGQRLLSRMADPSAPVEKTLLRLDLIRRESTGSGA